MPIETIYVHPTSIKKHKVETKLWLAGVYIGHIVHHLTTAIEIDAAEGFYSSNVKIQMKINFEKNKSEL